MKNIVSFTFLFICFYSLSFAQTNYCKDIHMTINDMKGDTTYTTSIQKENHGMYLKKTISRHGNNTGILFKLTEVDAHYDAHGVLVKFDDGTILSSSNDVICKYLNADDHYLYLGIMGLNDYDNNIQTFKTKKVVKFQMDNIDVPIDDAFAIKFRAWVNCIANIK